MKRHILILAAVVFWPLVCNAAYLVDEDFNAASFPAGWVTNSLVLATTGGYGGSQCWYLNANGDYIITPLLTTPDTMTFQYRGTSGFLVMSVNSVQDPADTGWTPVWTNAGNNVYYEVSLDLSGYSDISVRFTRLPSAGNHYIDDLRVTDRMAPPPGETLTLSDLPVSNTLLLPSLSDIPTLAFVLVSSSNGRTLRSLVISNTGTMPVSSIQAMRLIRDADDSRTFTAGDEPVAELAYDGSGRWTNGNISFPSNLDPPAGKRFLVLLDTAGVVESNRTFRASIPAGSLVLDSGVSNSTMLSGSRTLSSPSTPQPPQAPVKISQLATRGTLLATDEFVELYNPLNIPVDLAGWKVEYFGGSSWSVKVTVPAGTNIIPAKGYYLVGTTNCLPLPDIYRNLGMADGAAGSPRGLRLKDAAGIVADTVIFEGAGNVTRTEAEGGLTAPAPNLSAGFYNRSLLRKASAISTVSSMTSNGIEEFAGNGYDTDNNYDDFLLLPARKPRNSFPEIFSLKHGPSLPDLGVAPGTSNAAVFSITYTNSRGAPLQKLTLGNTGSVTLAQIRLVRDFPPLGVLDGMDTPAGTLLWNFAGYYTNGSLNLPSGSSWLAVIDIPPETNGKNGRIFHCVLPAGRSQSVTGISNAEGLTNAPIIRVVVDRLSFTAHPVPARTIQVGESAASLAFSLRSSEFPIHLSSFILTNRGSLADSRVSSLTLFRKTGTNPVQREPVDPPLGYFVNSAARQWTFMPFAAVDISSTNTATNFLVSFTPTTTFTNTLFAVFGINPGGLVSSGIARAPAGLLTNAGFLKITNSRPPAPKNLIAVSTNAAFVRLQWTAYTNLPDFRRFVLSFGTNASLLTNNIFLSNITQTTASVTGLKADRDWFFLLRAGDSAGRLSTNRSVLKARTKTDIVPPVFDPHSLQITINNRVAHLSWTAGQDQSHPLTYLIYLWPSGTDPATNNPAFRSTNLSFPLSLNTGSWSILIACQDAFSNRSPIEIAAVSNILIGNSSLSLDDVYFFPNPLKEGEELAFNFFTDNAEILLYTVRGDLVLRTEEKIFRLPAHLAAGVYFVVVRDGEVRKKKRLIYLK